MTRADTAPFSPSQRRWWRQNDWFNKPVLTCEAQMCKVGFHQRVDGKSNVGADTHARLGWVRRGRRLCRCVNG